MQTEKIQFSVERMKDAIRYETRDGRKVTQVTVFEEVANGHPVRAVVDNHIYCFNVRGMFYVGEKSRRDLFIITEKQIKYPCLCWVSDAKPNPSKEGSKGVTLMRCENYGAASHDHWNYSTPLTDDELAEFGLARVEK